MRASTLGNSLLAVDREIGSKYDAVIEVKDKLPEIELVAGMDITALIQELQYAQDFSGITVVIGDTPNWDPVTKVLTVPVENGDKGDKGDQGIQGPQGQIGPQGPRGAKGDKGDTESAGKDGINGVNGLNGKIPVIEFQVDDEFNMTYEVVGYKDGPGSANTEIS